MIKTKFETYQSQMTCLACTDIDASNPANGITHANCGCTSNCNDDKACNAGAILNNENQCQCLFDHLPGIDESGNQFCSTVS